MFRSLTLILASTALLSACGGEGDVIGADSATQSGSATIDTIRIDGDGLNLYYDAESTEDYRISGSNNTIGIGGTANEVKVTGDNNRVEVYGVPVEEIDITGNDNSILARMNTDIDDRGNGNQIIRY